MAREIAATISVREIHPELAEEIESAQKKLEHLEAKGLREIRNSPKYQGLESLRNIGGIRFQYFTQARATFHATLIETENS